MAITGIQRQVLGLYRKFLVEIKKKPAENQIKFKKYVRSQFDEHSKVSKREFATIEWYIRKGEKQLEGFKNPNLTDIQL